MRNENVNEPQNQQSCQNAVSKSVLLTGKCKEDFENGIIELINKLEKTPISDKKRCVEWIYDTNQLIQNAHYILWFDSVENMDLFINKWSDNNWQYSIDDGNMYPSEMDFISREEATNEAILKANEIYNERFV